MGSYWKDIFQRGMRASWKWMRDGGYVLDVVIAVIIANIVGGDRLALVVLRAGDTGLEQRIAVAGYQGDVFGEGTTDLGGLKALPGLQGGRTQDHGARLRGGGAGTRRLHG